MQNRVVGDSINFESVIKDRDGTAVTSAAVTLTVLDGMGSTVLNGVSVSHYSSGTYRLTGSTVGWNRGPIQETWVAKHSTGTITQPAINNFRIIGSEVIQTYVFKDELKNYHENVEDYFDGNEEAIIGDAYNEVNSKLESLGIRLPLKPNSEGFYDQPLRDLNAYAAIMRIVSKRQGGMKLDDQGRPWFKYFEDKAGSIYKGIEKKAYSFSRDTSAAESGIGVATKCVGSAVGVLETNWKGGVGTGFTDGSHERAWYLTITGTGTSGRINECTYVFSRDDETTYIGTGTTSYGWEHLYDGVFVRFHRGTSAAGTNLFAVGEKWAWRTNPVSQSSGGKRTAQSY